MDLRILSCLIFFACLLHTSFGCSCSISHPQQHACRADFVIVAKVKNKTVKDDQVFYDLKIKKEFKMSKKAAVALKSGRLSTAEDEAQCGVGLKVKEVYLITGKTINGLARVNLCNYIHPWKQITPRQRKGFRKLYYQGCECDIKWCPWFRTCFSDVSRATCMWDYGRHRGGEDCQLEHGICLRKQSGKCTWVRNMAQKSCEKLRNTKRQRELDLEP